MRLCLISMPWLATDTPSLALGILRRRVAEELPATRIADYHGTLRWAEYLLEHTAGALTPSACSVIGDRGLAHGLGDWVFAGALYDDPHWRLTELRNRAERWDLPLELAVEMRGHAMDFVTEAVADILATEPDVVGLTTTFMQSVASLAVARRIKRLSPNTLVVFGGANCEGPMGHALHRNHRHVDYVVRGEGELAFPALLKRIEEGGQPADLAGICWWDGDKSVANPETHQLVPPALYRRPDHDGWFRALGDSPLREHLSPYLVIEGSRGCWWGERHHCTFCGLNAQSMAYRSKPAEVFWEEVSFLVERHQVLDVMTADNILDVGYYRELLPRMKASGWDLRLQFEAKANVTSEQIRDLSEAGVRAVQFGIESLATETLKIMDKGIAGTTNVRVLRDSDGQHLTVIWNYLYGFPGETDDCYWNVIRQMPALVHLQPPSNGGRIALERFSPYFDRPELGFERRAPAGFYADIFDLPESELVDLAYFFDCDDQGISGAVEQALLDAITRWKRDHPRSSLFMTRTPAELTIHDHRVGWAGRQHVLSGWQRAAYESLDRGRTAVSVRKSLAEQGFDVDLATVEAWLAQCIADGLVYGDAGSFVALATTDVPVRVALSGPRN